MSGNLAARKGVAPSAGLLYFYGVIPDGQEMPAELRALRRHIPGAAVAALAETVAASELDPATLDDKLQDVEWVARLARKHESVLGRAMQHGPVVPARLCTVFSTLDALERSVAANGERLTALLSDLHGRQEWGLKAFCDEARLRTTLARDGAGPLTIDPGTTSVGPGASFLLRKQREAELTASVGDRVASVVDEVLATVDGRVGAVTIRPVLSRRVTGRRQSMVLNAAVLVDAAGQSALQELVAVAFRRFARSGFSFQLSGPWPPYSFCTLGDGDAVGSAEDPSSKTVEDRNAPDRHSRRPRSRDCELAHADLQSVPAPPRPATDPHPGQGGASDHLRRSAESGEAALPRPQRPNPPRPRQPSRVRPRVGGRPAGDRTQRTRGRKRW